MAFYSDIRMVAMREPSRLSTKSAASYLEDLLNVKFHLQRLEADFCAGLHAAILAIWNSNKQICDSSVLLKLIRRYTSSVPVNGGDENNNINIVLSRMSPIEINNALIALVRLTAGEYGWLEGWKVLASADPESGLHQLLMDDSKSPSVSQSPPLITGEVVTGVKVYNKVTVSSAKLPKLDIQLSVVRTAEPGNIAQIGPKTIGGHTWKKDEKYLAAVRSWNIPSDLLLGPCILFAWVGSFKKLVLHSETPEHQAACWTAQLLGIVDYDIDFDEKNMKGGIEHVAVRTAKMAAANEGKLRGAGWAGLMVMDQQMFNRDIQMRWAKDGKGSFVIGPGEISPYDFAVAGYVDCAGLPPFAYQSAAQLPASRTAMFVGTLFCNMHDLIYDMGCSSRISAAAYAYSTGVFEFDIPQAWVVGMIDKVAKKSLAGIADQQPLAGEDALMVVCVWNAFNVRYRAWERVIKYSRLLRNSKSKVAAGILERAEENLILVADSLDVDIGKAFEQALDPSNASKLVSRDRYTIKYVLKDPVPVLIASGVESPKLCEDCYAPFLETFNLSNDVIQAIQSIPEAISNSIPVSIAAAIRRGCLFGASPVCCDDCACVIGLWANLTSEKVVISLMDLEPQLLSKDFMAMMYFIGCVAFHPLRIMSVLAGFDLNADITFVKGAMGERDVVDC